MHHNFAPSTPNPYMQTRIRWSMNVMCGARVQELVCYIMYPEYVSCVSGEQQPQSWVGHLAFV